MKEETALPSPHRLLRHGLAAAALAAVFLAGAASRIAAQDPEPPYKVDASSPFTIDSPMRLDGGRVAVDPDIPRYAPCPPLTGELNIVGSGGLYWQARVETLLDLWINLFKAAHPTVKIRKALYSTPAAPLSLVEQTTQLGLMTREPMPDELYAFRNKVFKPMLVPVGGGSYSYDEGTPMICIIVNKDNPLEKMSLPQLDAVFSKTRKRAYKEDITHWGQLGLTGEWSDKTIHLYGLQWPDGIPNYLMTRVLDGGQFKDSLQEQHQDPKMKGMDKIALRVGEDRYGIGYVNRWNATGSWDATAPTLPNLKILSLSEKDGGPSYAGTYEDVWHHTYPLARFIFLAPNKTPGKPLDPLAKEFIRAALSREGQEAVARTVYMPLGWALIRPSLTKLE